MAKGRARLTHKKKSTKGKIALGHEENAPTTEEWKGLTQYHTFQVSDEDDKSFDFSVGDVAKILPNTHQVGDSIEPHEYWICKIIDIRARNENDVWARVEWYWSAKDAENMDKTFDASHCGEYERLKADHPDCISSQCFDGKAYVKLYNETDLDQESIGDEDFYYRYTVNRSAKLISPFPNSSASCVCGRLYNPTDSSPDLAMRFCPQPTCRKFFHRGCLSSATYPRSNFLVTDPDSGLPLPLPNESASAEPPKKRQRVVSTLPPDPAYGPAFSTLPRTLLCAAAQPIIRGGVYGVAGNVSTVVAARRVVCSNLRDNVSVDDWETRLPLGWEGTLPKGWDAQDVVFNAVVDVEGGLEVKSEDGVVVKAEGEGPGRVKLEGGSASSRVKSERGSTGRRKRSTGKGRVKVDPMAALQCPLCEGPI
ncbi:BAH domain-containing protein [Favolaschia claudopus]|uniref:BAH domain-containing protein n=1 Tax=Favolaschia claudopus TaxID=2862362 RepID=A0AAW0B5M7_9AGAR